MSFDPTLDPIPAEATGPRRFYGGWGRDRRPLILAGMGAILLGLFWFGSRYPQLLYRSQQIGQALPSMAYASEIRSAGAGAGRWENVLIGALNWLGGMKVGMTFGVLAGALLHTTLRYYPLKVGTDPRWNTLRGAALGVPMGVCVNCAVPMACGVTRGHGRIEVALGFLFSSPNFNPVVMAITFFALPWQMGVVKYAILLLLILVLVPFVMRRLERSGSLIPQIDRGIGKAAGGEAEAAPSSVGGDEPFVAVLKGVARDYVGHVWMLLKPTVALMVLAAFAASLLLTWVPWQTLLSEATPGRLAWASLISVFMPVPIALDVLFATQLQAQGISAGYVMLFATTLGTYSILPAIYLWREVSRPLSALLFLFFLIVGWIVGLLF